MIEVGARVIVRASMAGVYAGEVQSVAGDDSWIVLAPGARQIHYWETGGSVPQIAERGVGGDRTRITAPSTSAVRLMAGAQIVQICVLSDLAWRRIQAHPEWRGGL